MGSRQPSLKRSHLRLRKEQHYQLLLGRHVPRKNTAWHAKERIYTVKIPYAGHLNTLDGTCPSGAMLVSGHEAPRKYESQSPLWLQEIIDRVSEKYRRDFQGAACS